MLALLEMLFREALCYLEGMCKLPFNKISLQPLEILLKHRNLFNVLIFVCLFFKIHSSAPVFVLPIDNFAVSPRHIEKPIHFLANCKINKILKLEDKYPIL